jgi:hypothetical protein
MNSNHSLVTKLSSVKGTVQQKVRGSNDTSMDSSLLGCGRIVMDLQNVQSSSFYKRKTFFCYFKHKSKIV